MKKALNTLAGFLFIISIYSCIESSVECDERELRSVSFGFESSLEDWINLGGNIEAKHASDIEISADIFKQGSKSVKFTVSPASNINNGNRAELTFDQMIESGDETFYEYNLFIPTDYWDVSSLRADDGKPNWQILGQWHDQPDECLGETWEDIADHSPPIALYYNFLTLSDNEYTNLLSDPDFTEIFGMDPNWNDISTIALEYSGSVIAIHEIKKGEWVRLKFNIKWSEDSDGFIQAWIGQNAFTNGKITGSNMLNNASHYFKFGFYRNPTSPFTNKVYYDDLEIY